MIYRGACRAPINHPERSLALCEAESKDLSDLRVDINNLLALINYPRKS